MSILNQNLLTLDFWKDEVTYAGHTLPTGSIGCAAMNISDEQIGQLIQLAVPLAAVVELIKDGTPTSEHFTVAKESVFQITQMMRTTYPFSLFDFPADGRDIQQIFSAEYTENAIAYIKAAQELGMAAVFDEQYKKGVGIVKLINELAQLGSTLMIYKHGMIDFAHKLHHSKRTPEGYAETFAEHFNATPTFCGKWFLTTDARQTKYCGGLAPGDKLRRTCRQIGNLKGREQRELADDHPIKVIYTRRMNTITQYLHRGTLDEQAAAMMKQLAKDKLELAILDVAYANGSYEAEMSQRALLNEARKHL